MYEVCKNIPSIIVGNKIDLPKKVEMYDVEQCIKFMNALYIETSVILNLNIDETFESIGRLILGRTQDLEKSAVKTVVIPFPNNPPASREAVKNPYSDLLS